jgi:hypothetical protein
MAEPTAVETYDTSETVIGRSGESIDVLGEVVVHLAIGVAARNVSGVMCVLTYETYRETYVEV